MISVTRTRPSHEKLQILINICIHTMPMDTIETFTSLKYPVVVLKPRVEVIVLGAGEASRKAAIFSALCSEPTVITLLAISPNPTCVVIPNIVRDGYRILYKDGGM